MELGATVLQVLAALVVTLALVFACAWVVRRFGTVGMRGGQIIKVLSAASLGSRERVLLLEVHGRQLLVGVTSNAVTPLHVFDAGTPAVPEAVADFRSILKGLTPRT
jgi:flagellar protein FliO/FliZ